MFKKIRKSLKQVKEIKELLKDGVQDDTRNYFYSSEITKEKYILRKNSKILKESHIAIAGLSITEFDDEYVPCVYYDNTFKTLSEEAQNFVIQHELGHFYRHQDILVNATKAVRDVKLEFEADEYAMCKVGQENSIKALNEIKELLDKISFGRNKVGLKELDRRIEYIKSLM